MKCTLPFVCAVLNDELIVKNPGNLLLINDVFENSEILTINGEDVKNCTPNEINECIKSGKFTQPFEITFMSHVNLELFFLYFYLSDMFFLFGGRGGGGTAFRQWLLNRKKSLSEFKQKYLKTISY